MNQSRIPRQEFIDSYKESLGIEGTETLLKEVFQKLGLTHQEDYSKEEALMICKELKGYPGFPGIIAGILYSRFVIR